MTRAINVIESRTVFSLQTVLGKGGQLSSYAGYLNKPDYFQTAIDNYRKVTPADVQRVANKYLNANRLVMGYVQRKGDAPKMNAEANKPQRGSGFVRRL